MATSPPTRRPITELSTRTKVAGPAFESRQGRKPRESGQPCQRSLLWGLYERTAVKSDLASYFLFPFFSFLVRSILLFDLKKHPFFRPDPCVRRERGAQDLSRTAR